MSVSIKDFYIVATPIGNMQDISLRAIETLRQVDIILCEDTRVTAKLLSFYGIKKKLMVYNDHSDDKIRSKIIQNLHSGLTMALVSDAGTPCISDPGYRLINKLYEENIKITTIPGACAAISALVLSGFPSNNFYFAGFLPPKKNARLVQLKETIPIHTTLIFYETGKRLLAVLEDVQQIFGEVSIAVIREITKIYEEVKRASISSIISDIKENGQLKGEIVLLIDNRKTTPELSEVEIEELIRELLKKMSLKDAVSEISTSLGINKNILYKKALSIKNNV